MVGHGGSSAGSYLADPTSPIPSHCASIVATSTLRVKLSYCYDRLWRHLRHYLFNKVIQMNRQMDQKTDEQDGSSILPSEQTPMCTGYQYNTNPECKDYIPRLCLIVWSARLFAVCYRITNCYIIVRRTVMGILRVYCVPDQWSSSVHQY